jgi:hypothetical protein
LEVDDRAAVKSETPAIDPKKSTWACLKAFLMVPGGPKFVLDFLQHASGGEHLKNHSVKPRCRQLPGLSCRVCGVGAGFSARDRPLPIFHRVLSRPVCAELFAGAEVSRA